MRGASLAVLCAVGAGALVAPRATRPRARRRRSALDCICVNCKFVDRCGAYHVVEAKHEQPHLSEAPDFNPRAGSPTVALNIFPESNEVELDVTACEDFVEEKGRWVKMMPKGTLLKHGFDPDFIPT